MIHQPGGLPRKADLHHELAALGGAAGQRPGDFRVPPCDQDRLAERLLRSPGMLPAVEDRGHVPGDAQLAMLDRFGSRPDGAWLKPTRAGIPRMVGDIDGR